MKINLLKIKVMVIIKSKNSPKIIIVVNDRIELEQVTAFSHGRLLTEDARCQDEVKRSGQDEAKRRIW